MTVKHFPFPDLMRYCGRESEITISDDSPTNGKSSLDCIFVRIICSPFQKQLYQQTQVQSNCKSI